MDSTPGKPTPNANASRAKKSQSVPDAKHQSVGREGSSQEATQPFSDTVSPAREGKTLAENKGQTTRPMAATVEFSGSTGEGGTELLRETANAESSPPGAVVPSAKPAASDAAGQTFGDFRLEVKLGEGGMGAVYKAHQISMDRIVAFKMLSKSLAQNQDFVARFRREAQTMAKVDHPNIVRGLAVGEANGQHYVAMEFIDGQSMQKWMNKLGKLSVPDALHVALCCAYALQHAHEQHLVHRDIKPDNILVTSKGLVKVADLGLAKNTDDDMSLTQSGTGFGTPYYMPLEQYRDAKRVDARADIYALGITLYYFLTGKLPYVGETHFDIIKVKESAKFTPARRHNPEIPERLDLMIDKMIQKERGHRYQSCAEVIEALESIGLASEYPTFIAKPGGSSAKQDLAPTVRVSTLPTRTKARAAAPPAQETPDLWVLRCTDASGQKVKRQVSSGRLKQLIERDEIDLASATVVRAGEENQRPLSSVPEFSSLVQSKKVKAKTDRRSQRLDDAYAKLERDAKRQRIFKAIKNFFRNVTSVVILVGVVSGLIIAGWWLLRNKDAVMQKVQDAARTVQDSAGPTNPGAAPEQITNPAPER